MYTLSEVQTWKGLEVLDRDGDKIGKIDDVYLDRQTGEPAWIAVKTGLFGMNHSFVPIRDATATTDGVTVPYEKQTVKDAPNAEPDGELSEEEERRLYEHYGVSFGDFDYGRDYASQPGTGSPESVAPSRARLRRL